VLSGLLLFRSTGVTSVLGSLLGLGAAAAGAYVAVKSFANDNTLMGSLAAAVAVAGTVTMGFNIYKGVGHVKKWRASKASQKSAAQDAAAQKAHSEQAQADAMESERTRLRQQKAELDQPRGPATVLPEWAGSLEHVQRAPNANKMIPDMEVARYKAPPEGMAWTVSYSTREVKTIDQMTFGRYQSEGIVEGKYADFIIVLQ
jgi:hypothetical protein